MVSILSIFNNGTFEDGLSGLHEEGSGSTDAVE